MDLCFTGTILRMKLGKCSCRIYFALKNLVLEENPTLILNFNRTPLSHKKYLAKFYIFELIIEIRHRSILTFLSLSFEPTRGGRVAHVRGT